MWVLGWNLNVCNYCQLGTKYLGSSGFDDLCEAGEIKNSRSLVWGFSKVASNPDGKWPRFQKFFRQPHLSQSHDTILHFRVCIRCFSLAGWLAHHIAVGMYATKRFFIFNTTENAPTPKR